MFRAKRMDLFCTLAPSFRFYVLRAQNTHKLRPQQRVVLDGHVPRQHLLAGVGKTEVDFYRSPVKNMAQQVFHLAHLRAIARGDRQKVSAGALGALFALDALGTVAAKALGGVVGFDRLHTLHDQARGLVLFNRDKTNLRGLTLANELS